MQTVTCSAAIDTPSERRVRVTGADDTPTTQVV